MLAVRDYSSLPTVIAAASHHRDRFGLRCRGRLSQRRVLAGLRDLSVLKLGTGPAAAQRLCRQGNCPSTAVSPVSRLARRPLIVSSMCWSPITSTPRRVSGPHHRAPGGSSTGHHVGTGQLDRYHHRKIMGSGGDWHPRSNPGLLEPRCFECPVEERPLAFEVARVSPRSCQHAALIRMLSHAPVQEASIRPARRRDGISDRVLYIVGVKGVLVTVDDS
ncbi:Uncharacterised protein [Mycolicibacterium fortuitum]|uniref:Uncharacterized protein n=1 Tax=Mycolicibacterium fortuitum TaxID=1766 RepID=A0A378WDH9_MYCFO|nr:Uncharacterised protein [Mycolicibacterium fortuitum]